MKARRWWTAVVVVGAVALGGVAVASVVAHLPPSVGDCVEAGRRPAISPDYAGVVMPPNIAPLNFVVKELGSAYLVKVRGDGEPQFQVYGKSSSIVLPPEKWRRLLDGKPKAVHFDVFVKGEDGRWVRYETVSAAVAPEKIDPYLFYRKIKPMYNSWGPITWHQRNIETFQEDCLLDNAKMDDRKGCMNCHAFYENRPDMMVVQIRGPHGGMLMFKDGKLEKLETRTPRNKAPASVGSWHPSGRLAAFSINKVVQVFHMAGSEVRDVIDMNSDLIIYSVDDKAVTSTPRITQPEFLEAFPQWSTDGKYLYFCRAPKYWTDNDAMPLDQFRDVRYSLMRISYDIDTGQWGDVETVLSAEKMGMSITEPRFSPDGRWCVMCLCSYSYQGSFKADADLYILDTASGECRPMECNSDQSESWHSWSSNGRWLAFSSRRRDGQFLKTYFSYVDETGKSHKPLLLPQEDPTDHDYTILAFHLPELVKGPMPVGARDILNVIQESELVTGDAMTGASPRAAGSAAPGAYKTPGGDKR
ncbi:MAG: PD40 domain-containing protein [Planctomycetes bacterium]|nr:PD40 domain-containing protein [Planctomycetota bacterium]